MVRFIYEDVLYSFSLQWHLTVKCDQNCKHCYMKDEKFYKQQLENPLTYEDCIEIIDRYKEFTNHWNFGAFISFTGGDPLLRDDFFDILKYCKKNKINTGILGNPFHINKKIALKLERLGVSKYQLSIDGMEKTHDELRSKGSFKETLRALRILNETDIHTLVMFTLSKKNKDDLLDVIDLVVENNVDRFAFTRLIPIGAGESFRKDLFSAKEFRDLLLVLLEKYRQYEKNNCRTLFSRKACNPWIILERDLGLLTPTYMREEDDLSFLRCPIGRHLTILADGTVLACRKLPIKIGKFPEESFEEVLSSKEFKYVNEQRCSEKCRGCELEKICRGCAAMAYATTGDIRKPDLNCWW